MNRTARIRLAALVVAVAVIAGGLAIALPRGGAGTITVTAYFPKTIGLFKASHVRVLGVDVGRVTSIKPDGEKVKVEMSVDAARKIPADARAVIVPISLIADRYIQLTPVYTSGPALRDGAVIDTDRTAIPAELDDLLAQLKKLLDAVDAGTLANPRSIGAAVKNLAAALEGAGQDLSDTLTGAGALSGAVSGNAAAIDQTVVHLSNLLKVLSARRADIAQLNTRLAQALGAVAAEHTTLASALGNIALLTEQLGSLVKAHRADLEADLEVLAKTTDAVVDHQDSVLESLHWLHVLADGAEKDHKGGAIHRFGNGPLHIDVRDAHLFGCAPAVPAGVCLLIGLTGSPVSLAVPVQGTGSSVTASGPAGAVAPGGDAGPVPGLVFDLLPDGVAGVTAPAGASPAATPSPSIRDMFSGLGGLIDHALGWVI